jgi:C4-dicarboxylate-specific signal transduction histidine kinase
VSVFRKREIQWHNFKNGFAGDARVRTVVLIPFYKGELDFGVIELKSSRLLLKKDWMADVLMETAERLASFKYERDLKDQLQEKKELLANASKLMIFTELSSGMVHQINSPITIIYGKLKMVNNAIKKNKIDLEGFMEQIECALRNLDRVASVVRSLRALSQDERSIELEPVDMRDVISTSVSLMEQRFQLGGIELTVYAKDPVVIQGSQAQLSQVLLSLLENSLSALEKLQDKWVKINLIEDSSYMYLYVTDSGNGIPPELARKIMLPFFTTKGAGKSSGLGLSVAQGIIESHGGDFYLNQHHPNTQFVIRLPKPG